MLVRHFARLPVGLVILWCFLIWYLVMIVLHFEASPRLWLNGLGMSMIIGTVLRISMPHDASAARDFWRTFRLYAIPFCVSSFSALVRDDGFYAILSPALHANLLATGGCLLFVGWVVLARMLDRDGTGAGD